MSTVRLNAKRAKMAAYLAYRLRMSKAANQCNRLGFATSAHDAWNRAYREYDLAWRLLYRSRLADPATLDFPGRQR